MNPEKDDFIDNPELVGDSTEAIEPTNSKRKLSEEATGNALEACEEEIAQKDDLPKLPKNKHQKNDQKDDKGVSDAQGLEVSQNKVDPSPTVGKKNTLETVEIKAATSNVEKEVSNEKILNKAATEFVPKIASKSLTEADEKLVLSKPLFDFKLKPSSNEQKNETKNSVFLGSFNSNPAFGSSLTGGNDKGEKLGKPADSFWLQFAPKTVPLLSKTSTSAAKPEDSKVDEESQRVEVKPKFLFGSKEKLSLVKESNIDEKIGSEKFKELVQAGNSGSFSFLGGSNSAESNGNSFLGGSSKGAFKKLGDSETLLNPSQTNASNSSSSLLFQNIDSKSLEIPEQHDDTNETLLHFARGKIYTKGLGKYNLIGDGLLKLLRSNDFPEKTRVVMNRSVTGTLLHNSYLYKQFSCSAKEKCVTMILLDEGSTPVTYLLKLKDGATAQKLCNELQAAKPTN